MGGAPVWPAGIVHCDDQWQFDSGDLVDHWFGAVGGWPIVSSSSDSLAHTTLFGNSCGGTGQAQYIEFGTCVSTHKNHLEVRMNILVWILFGAIAGWISKIATSLAGDKRSITILINGRDISRTDVEYSLLENRPTFVMRGTGRMADEITLTGNVVSVDISQKSELILETLKSKLL